MKNNRWIVIPIILGVLLLGGYTQSKLKYDFSISTFTAENSEEYANYREYSDQFPSTDQYVTIGIELDQAINDWATFQRFVAFTDTIEKLNGVLNLNSITKIILPQKALLGKVDKRLLSWKSEAQFRKKFRELVRYPDIRPKFISEDNRAVRVYLQTKNLNLEESSALIQKIKKQAKDFGFTKVYLVGKGAFQAFVEKAFFKEMIVLSSLGIILLVALFYFFFRGYKSVLLSITMLMFNVSCTMILFWLTGIKIGILTLTVPLLIVVLSFCDIVHILYAYKSHATKKADTFAMTATIKKLNWSLFLTSLTTFLAFAIFFLSPVMEIIDFALITCSGIFIAYFSSRFLFPNLILLVGVPPFEGNPPLEKVKNLLIKRLEKSKRTAIVASVLILFLGGVALMNSQINQKPAFEGDNRSEMGKSMQFFNTHFEGTRSIDVILKDTNVLTAENMMVIDSIENYLIKNYQCNSVFSVNTAVKRLNRYNHFGKPSFYKFPDTISAEFIEVIDRYSDVLGLQNTVTENNKLLRVSGRLKEADLQTIHKKNKGLEHFLKSFNRDTRSLFISGNSYVNDESQIRVTQYILLGVLLSLLVAGLLIWVFYRSFRLMIAALIPNLLPLLSALCLMPIIGIELNAFSVMALSIILGLSVDDTIYFIGNSFKRGQKPRLEDLKSGIRKNTFPVIVTSVLLSVGFGILSLSDFSSNRDIGILVSLILLIALLSDLIVLPALMKWMFKQTK